MYCDAKGASFMLARSCQHVLPCICQKFEDTVPYALVLILRHCWLHSFCELGLVELADRHHGGGSCGHIAALLRGKSLEPMKDLNLS